MGSDRLIRERAPLLLTLRWWLPLFRARRGDPKFLLHGSDALLDGHSDNVRPAEFRALDARRSLLGEDVESRRQFFVEPHGNSGHHHRLQRIRRTRCPRQAAFSTRRVNAWNHCERKWTPHKAPGKCLKPLGHWETSRERRWRLLQHPARVKLPSGRVVSRYSVASGGESWRQPNERRQSPGRGAAAP